VNVNDEQEIQEILGRELAATEHWTP